MPESIYDVLNLISSIDVKKALASYPDNIINLVVNLCQHLEETARRSPTFANKASATRSLASYVPGLAAGGSRSHSTDDDQADKHILNCLRVLSRVIPFVLAHDGGALEDRIFWSTLPTGANNDANARQFVIDDEDDVDADSSLLTTAPSSPSAKKTAGPAAAQTLGQQLLKLSIDLLYVPHFTLAGDAAQPSQTKRVQYQIWENGVGSATALPCNREIEKNRIEVLRLLLVLLSKALYTSPTAPFAHGPDAYAREYSDAPSNLSSANRWHELLVQGDSSNRGIPRKVILTLLCSLLNFALKAGTMHVASTSGLLGAVSGAAGDTYEKLLHGGRRKEDAPRLVLVRLCMQTLNAILVTSATTDDPGTVAAESPAVNESNRQSRDSSLFTANGSPPCNMFATYIGKIHRQSDIAFISEVREGLKTGRVG